MRFRHAVGCFLIFAASVLPVLGQTRSNPRIYNLAGYVRDDSDQHAMENVRVDLKQSAGIPINSTFTRGNGEFEFAGLSTGDYIIEVNERDYEPARQTVTIFNSSVRSVSIFLSKPMVITTVRSGATISAHELSIPHKAYGDYEKGLELLYTKSDFRAAIAQFQRAIKGFPNFYEAYAKQGSAYVRLGELGPAEESMKKSISLSSGQYSEPIFMLAGLLVDTNRYSEAETVARQGIKADVASWHGPFELTRALLGLKRSGDAEKSAIEARDMKPDNPPVYLMLANIHIQMHDYPALLKDLDSYLKLVPNGPSSDQARKTQSDVRAAMKQADEQAAANPQQKTSDGLDANMQTSGEDKELPSTSLPDSAVLPSLPPPNPDKQ